MNRAFVVLPLAAVLVAAAWPASPAQRASTQAGVCEQMTSSRLMENPTLANAYADALRSGDQAEVARVQALFARIRSAHGCGGAVALPEPAPPDSAPPDAAPRLPPGHPPISPGQHPPVAAQFDGPGIVTI
jgi:hypothetical protein